MNRRTTPWLSVLLLALTMPAFAQSGGGVQIVDGYRLYFGIVPSVLLRAQNTPHSGSARDAHGLPRGDYRNEAAAAWRSSRRTDGQRRWRPR